MDSVSFIANLKEESREWLFENLKETFYRANDVIIKQGETNESLVLIETGCVGVIVGNSFDSRVGTLGPGRVAGEASFLTRSSKANATLIVDEDCKVLHISFEKIEAKMMEDGQFAVDFYKSIARFLSKKLEKSNLERV